MLFSIEITYLSLHEANVNSLGNYWFRLPQIVIRTGNHLQVQFVDRRKRQWMFNSSQCIVVRFQTYVCSDLSYSCILFVLLIQQILSRSEKAEVRQGSIFYMIICKYVTLTHSEGNNTQSFLHSFHLISFLSPGLRL